MGLRGVGAQDTQRRGAGRRPPHSDPALHQRGVTGAHVELNIDARRHRAHRVGGRGRGGKGTDIGGPEKNGRAELRVRRRARVRRTGPREAVRQRGDRKEARPVDGDFGAVAIVKLDAEVERRGGRAGRDEAARHIHTERAQARRSHHAGPAQQATHRSPRRAPRGEAVVHLGRPRK